MSKLLTVTRYADSNRIKSFVCLDKNEPNNELEFHRMDDFGCFIAIDNAGDICSVPMLITEEVDTWDDTDDVNISEVTHPERKFIEAVNLYFNKDYKYEDFQTGH